MLAVAEVEPDREVQRVKAVQLETGRQYIFLARTSPKADMAVLGAVAARTARPAAHTAAIGVEGASTTDLRPAVGLSRLLDPRRAFRLVWLAVAGQRGTRPRSCLESHLLDMLSGRVIGGERA